MGHRDRDCSFAFRCWNSAGEIMPRYAVYLMPPKPRHSRWGRLCGQSHNLSATINAYLIELCVMCVSIWNDLRRGE